jgi:hypothetical protein
MRLLARSFAGFAQMWWRRKNEPGDEMQTGRSDMEGVRE